MSETEKTVRLRGVTKSYGELRAVNGLDLEAERGQILALLGPSGCGKTTTLRLIAGFERPDEGEISISGRPVASNRGFVAPEKRLVGMVFQDYALFPHINVRRNVAYGLKFSGEDSRNRVEEVLSLARLEGLGGRMPHELSGGQQQRVALARALAPAPEVLLLDEPFSNLDAALRTRVRREVRDILEETRVTTLFVTHDQEEALGLADHVAVMFGGGISQVAGPEEIYRSPKTREVASFVGEANFLDATAEEEGKMARCALGTVSLRDGTRVSGDAEVVIRPEEITVNASQNGNAKLVAREFFGYGQLLQARLDSGETLFCRASGERDFAPGMRVRVGVEGPLMAFPKTSTTL